MHAFGEIFFARNQTQNQKSVLREIVEMARVDEDIFLAEQIESEVFIGTRCRNAEDDIPAGFASKARTVALRCKLSIQCDEVGANAGEELRLELRASSEERGKRVLHRRVHREIRIGDDFETPAGFVFEILGAGESAPSGFHLRQAAEF